MRSLLLALLILSHFTIFANEPTVQFVRNEGQWDVSIKFMAQIPGGFLQVKNEGLQYIFYDGKALDELKHGSKESKNARLALGVNAHLLKVNFLNTNKLASSKGLSPNPEKRNYFIGNDESKWASNVSSFQEIVIDNIYEGVDLRLYTHQYSLKYEFIVEPNVDTKQIKIQYEGADDLKIDGNNLMVKTSLSTIIESKPYCFNQANNPSARIGFQEIKGQFKLEKNIVSFDFPQNFDHSQQLVIDPQLIFSTYSGSIADNWGHTATYDADGNLYAGGSALANPSGQEFPTTPGAFQIKNGSFWDMAIMKFNSDGTKLLYSSFLGGFYGDIPHSLIVNSKGELLIFGTSSSRDFPTTVGAYDRTFNNGVAFDPSTEQNFQNGSDIVVAKISADGSKLLSSTYIGGSNNDGLNTSILNYGDEFRGEIVTDTKDNVYISSITSSNNFPLVNSGKNIVTGGSDAVVFRMSPDLKELQWSTLLGGNNYDAAFSLKVGKNNNVYVCGFTFSSDLETNNSFRSSYGGRGDGFVAKFTNDKLENTSYLGTASLDLAQLLDLDQQDNVHIYGVTYGRYAVSSNVFQNANSGQFIQALDPDLKNSVFATVIGTGKGSPDIVPTAFLVNECGNIYIAGWGGKVNDNLGGGAVNTTTTTGLPVTSDAYRTATDGSNFYIALLEKGAKNLLYATYFGSANKEGSSGDHVDGGTCRFDKKGFIYHSACSCNRLNAPASFATTPTAYSRNNPSINCNNAAFKFDIDNLAVSFDAVEGTKKSASSKTDTLVGCQPFKVSFQNTSEGAKTYEWDLGGLRKSTIKSEEFSFDKPGTYTVILKGLNPLSCKKEEIARKIIKVNPFEIKVDKETIKECEGLKIQLLASGGIKYAWSPAEGLSATNIPNPSLTLSKSNSYTVDITNQFGCTGKKTVQVTVDNSFANVKSDTSVCRNRTIQLFATGGTRYRWSPAEGLSDTTIANPKADIKKAVTYQVLIQDEKTGCRTQKTINIGIDETFKPDFKLEKLVDCGKPTILNLTNNTKNATRFVWNFGNGDSLKVEKPEPYIYKNEGEYLITLKSYKADCELKITQKVEIERPLIPTNVITPNNDGKNDSFVMKNKLKYLEIYDRWGKAVLMTEDYQNNWGTGIASGTYYYKLQTSGGAECKGWIEVIN
jgi:gliding motility-associated-like protein